MTDREQIKETASDYNRMSLEDALRTLAFFIKISLDDNVFLERCRNKNNDAVGFYDYKNNCFWFYDLDLNKWVNAKPKNYLTQKIVKEYINKDKIILTKEEYDDLCANYDKVYEQAKADVLGNMSDGGTSCHWCIDENRRIGKEEALKQIWHKVADGDLPKNDSVVLAFYKPGYYATFLYLKNADDETGWWYGASRCKTEDIIAWTELPEYKE